MPKWKIQKNALVQGLLAGFCIINMVAAGLIEYGTERVLAELGGLVLALFTMVSIAADRRAQNNTKMAVWCTLAIHSIWTVIILTVLVFHWAIVILYFLELALCIYIWHKK